MTRTVKDWILIVSLLLAGLVLVGLYGLKYRQGGDVQGKELAGFPRTGC